jgi:DNA-binding XRE family transcriptional regulator
MSKGYTSKFIKAVEDADQNKLGVKLARVCIANEIPANDVAQFMGVTRMTVYFWFKGEMNVGPKHKEKIEKLVQKLST